MKYCPICKDYRNGEFRFCDQCGSHLLDVPDQNASAGEQQNNRSGNKHKENKTALKAIAIVLVIVILIGAGAAGFYVFKKHGGFFPNDTSGTTTKSTQETPEAAADLPNTDRAIALLEQGNWEQAYSVIESDDTAPAGQLRSYCEIEKAKQKLINAVSQLTFENINDTFDDAIIDENELMQILFGITEADRTSEYDLLPESLKKNFLFLTILCEMMEDNYELPDSAEAQQRIKDGSFFSGSAADVFFQIAEPYIENYSADEFWGMDVAETFRSCLSELCGDTNYQDIFSNEYTRILNTDKYQFKFEYVQATSLLANRDQTYFLLTGKTLDRE